MKVLLGCGLLSTALCWAQPTPGPPKEASQPFAGANGVVVRTPDSAQVALQKIKLLLRAQGYALDTANAAYVTTRARAFSAPAGGLTVPLTHRFRVAAARAPGGTQVAVTGQIIDDRDPKYHFVTPMRWTAKGDNSPDQTCFAAAERIAQAYPGGKIFYQQQKR